MPDAAGGPGGADRRGGPDTARPAATTVRRATPPTTRRAGGPHPRSRAEQALERALGSDRGRPGGEWNTVFRPDPLSPQFRVDLMWPEERCAVEIDGPEHRSPHQYEADRRRDTALQLAGFAVLRFTNSQVSSDLAGVLRAIRELVTNRRQTKE